MEGDDEKIGVFCKKPVKNIHIFDGNIKSETHSKLPKPLKI